MEKIAKDLKSGDKTPWYTIIKINIIDGVIIAKVQYNDGGIDYRQWDNLNATIPILE